MSATLVAPGVAAAVSLGRRRRRRRRLVATLVLTALVLALLVASLCLGRTTYSPAEVLAVVRGELVPGASFTVGELRLPRASMALLTGFAFGAAGATFQTMLRNPLASPDVIGITSGASAAAVVGLVVLELSPTATSAVAIVAALATALAIQGLAGRDGAAGARLVLVGIGVAAMLDSVVSYVVARAAQWDLQVAMRWLTGSLNGATWDGVVPVLVAVLLAAPVLLSRGRALELLQHGEETAAALGVPVARTRLVCLVAAVVLLAFATAASGPIAFVAFLAGPIAARVVGPGGSLLLPAGLVGAALVLGAPYLLHLLVRTHRSGGSL